MAIGLGLVVATLLGAADFLGGFTARRSAAGAVVFTSQSASLLVSLVAVLAIADPFPGARDLVLGCAAGAAALIGISSLYRGLAGGRMSVVASVSAVGSAVIPVVWGLVRGEHPAPIALLGGVVAIGAVVLVARPAAVDRTARPTLTFPAELGYSLGAAVGFGVGTTLFSEVGTASGFWPVLMARVVSVPLAFLVVVVVLRGPLLPHRADLPYVLAAGCLEAGSNLVLLVAFRHDLTSVIAPVISIYPAVTVLLARVVLGERVGPMRLAGIGVALVGLVLISLK